MFHDTLVSFAERRGIFMQDHISFSHLFASIDEIISYLKSIDSPNNYIKVLQQTQQALVALELINLSTYPTDIT